MDEKGEFLVEEGRGVFCFKGRVRSFLNFLAFGILLVDNFFFFVRCISVVRKFGNVVSF